MWFSLIFKFINKSMFNWFELLGVKMNLTVRLGKPFPDSSPCLPRQLGTGKQGRYTSGTLTVYLTSLSGSFCHLVPCLDSAADDGVYFYMFSFFKD